MVRVKEGKLIDHPFWYLRHSIKNGARDQRRRKAHYSLFPGIPVEDSAVAVVERLDNEALTKRIREHKDYEFLNGYYRTEKHTGADRVRALRARRRMRGAFT